MRELLGNPLIDANSLLEFPDADALPGLVNYVDIAGTHDQRRRHAAVLGGFGPYPHDASLAADGFFHGAHQRRIGWKLGWRRFRPHLDVEPVSFRGAPDFLDNWTRVDRFRVPELDAAGGEPDSHVRKRAVIVDDEVEVAKRRIILAVMKRDVAPQAKVQIADIREKGHQLQVGIQASARRGMGLAPMGMNPQLDVAPAA